MVTLPLRGSLGLTITFMWISSEYQYSSVSTTSLPVLPGIVCVSRTPCAVMPSMDWVPRSSCLVNWLSVALSPAGDAIRRPAEQLEDDYRTGHVDVLIGIEGGSSWFAGHINERVWLAASDNVSRHKCTKHVGYSASAIPAISRMVLRLLEPLIEARRLCESP